MAYWTPNACKLLMPVISAPMFLLSGPELLIAQCRAGIVGSFPALNARTPEILDEWLDRINSELAAARAENPAQQVAPYAVNLIVHGSNELLETHVDACVKHKVPIVITSMGSRPEVTNAIQSYGGIVLHDVVNLVHAHKAVERGVDGLIAVAAGAGGHGGALSPIAIVGEIREWWDGPLVVGGAISTGRGVLAAQAMGADMAYCGTRFIAAAEALTEEVYQKMVIEASAADVIYTDKVTGTSANFLRPSLEAAGLVPLPNQTEAERSELQAGKKGWRDIWSAGQGVGLVTKREPVADIIARMSQEYQAAIQQISELK